MAFCLVAVLDRAHAFPSSTAFSRRRTRLGAAAQARAPQVLEFTEPQTNVTVLLVGTMHYNPASIRLAAETIEDLGRRNALGSVIVESCDIRWNKTAEVTGQTPILKKVLGNEMRSASLAAMSFRRPVVLGDQRINVTSDNLGDAFRQTMVDLVTPFGGWKRFYEDVTEAFDVALPTGPGYMDASGFLDSRLLLAAPVSFFKYPLSFFVSSPVPSAAVLLLLLGLSSLDPGSDGSLSPGDIQFSELAGSVAFAFLEVVVFARLLVKTLLAERNEVLARNILEQCKRYASGGQGRMPSFFGYRLPFTLPLFEGGNSAEDHEVVYWYTPTSSTDVPISKDFLEANGKRDSEKAVVAVLGMAHCNGIMKLLKEERI